MKLWKGHRTPRRYNVNIWPHEADVAAAIPVIHCNLWLIEFLSRNAACVHLSQSPAHATPAGDEKPAGKNASRGPRVIRFRRQKVVNTSGLVAPDNSLVD